MIDKLQAFLVDRKMALLVQQKGQPNRRGKEMIEAQIRLIESMLIFISNNKNKEIINMDELKLTLDKQAMSLKDIRERQRKRGGNGTVAKAILKLVEELKTGQGLPVNAPGVSGKTVLSTIHRMKKAGELPKNILAITAQGGKEIYIGKE